MEIKKCREDKPMSTINTSYGNYGKPTVIYGNDSKKPEKSAESAVQTANTNTDTLTISGSTKGTQLTDYSKFYKGSESIASHGSGAAKHDTVVHYRFDTTDEDGNKVMEKMSKDETLQALKDISAQYGDNVIIEFSGDGLGKIFDYKALHNLPEDHREIPPEMITQLDGPTPLTDEQLAEMHGNHKGTDMEDVMRHLDPDAYKEYQAVKSEGLKKGTIEGVIDGMRYLLKWVNKNAKENPDWEKRYDPDKTAKQTLSERYKNADIYVADDKKTVNMFGGNKLFGIMLSRASANTLRSGHADDKERLLQIIDDGMKALSDMQEKLSGSGYKLGLNITGFRKFELTASNGNDTKSASTANELMRAITG